MLSKPDLLRHLVGGRLRFDPEVALDQIKQVSIDLRLGRKFSSFRERGYLPAIHVDPSLWDSQDLWQHEEREVFRLEPGKLVLAQTLERVHIPSDVVGLLEGRSSFARVGVTIHVTAPKIDPGFDATITLEMANFGRVAVDLRAGIDRPAQLMTARARATCSRGRPSRFRGAACPRDDTARTRGHRRRRWLAPSRARGRRGRWKPLFRLPAED